MEKYVALFWMPCLICLVTGIGGAWLGAWVIARLPTDFFTREPNGFRKHHPVLRVVLLGLKNALGIALLTLGVLMLPMPGPGTLVMILGIALIDFPRKREFFARILSSSKLRDTVNWVRRKWHRPPLKFPERT